MPEEMFEGCLKEFRILWHGEENPLMALESPRVTRCEASRTEKSHYGDLRTGNGTRSRGINSR